MGSLSLLQGNFLTQESNRGLLHCRHILYQLSYQGSLDRETPVTGLEKADCEVMQSIANRIRALGIEVSVSC